MNQREPNLVRSGLSQTVTRDGVTVRVSIVRLEKETSWSLEVVNSSHMGWFRSSSFVCAGRWRVTREAGRSAAEQGAKRP